MPFRLGPVELILILVIILVIFGVGKLTHLGGALGKALHDFRQSVSGEDTKPSQAKRSNSKPSGSDTSQKR